MDVILLSAVAKAANVDADEARALIEGGNWNVPLLCAAVDKTPGFLRQLLGSGALKGYKAGGRDWLIPRDAGDVFLKGYDVRVDING